MPLHITYTPNNGIWIWKCRFHNYTNFQKISLPWEGATSIPHSSPLSRFAPSLCPPPPPRWTILASPVFTPEKTLVTTRIDKVKWITAQICGKPKWHSFSRSLSWKRKIWALTLSHKMCPTKQTTEPKWWSWYRFSQEKLPHTLIPVIASTYCRKYAVPCFFLGHHLAINNKYIIAQTEEEVALTSNVLHQSLLASIWITGFLFKVHVTIGKKIITI